MEQELRKVEVKIGGIGWTSCKFSDVRTGDLFRLFEVTGESVTDEQGNTEFVAIKDAYQVDSLWCLETKDGE